MKKVVVTGGAGFIGSTLVDTLLQNSEYKVHVVDNLSAGKKENLNPKAILHEVDVRDKEKLSLVFKDSFCVFHLAAIPSVQYSIEFPEETESVNVGGTMSVLMVAKQAGVKKVIYSASGGSVYGDCEKFPTDEGVLPSPKSPYGLQKYVGEHLCRLWSEIHGLKTVSLRYFNVYGPRQSDKGAYASVVPIFLRMKKDGEELTVTGDGLQTRDFVHVRDVARANILAMENENIGNGEVINIGGGKERSVLEIAELIGGAHKFTPARIESRRSLADISLAKKVLDWEPKEDFEKGIEELKNL